MTNDAAIAQLARPRASARGYLGPTFRDHLDVERMAPSAHPSGRPPTPARHPLAPAPQVSAVQKDSL